MEVRVARLLSLVFEVDSRPGVTAGELADELGVSVRTIYRDVAALQAAGIPLYGEVGRAGGLRLVEGYRSRSAALRSDEAAALLAGVVPGVAEQLGLGADAERAARKVRSQSERGRDRPRSSSAPAIGVGEILVDPVGWYRSPDEVPHLTRALTVVVLIQTIFLLSVYAEILVTTNGGPGTASLNLPFLVYLNSIIDNDVGVGAAGGVIAIILANIVAIFLMRAIGKNLDA